jgi:hypothetical protein
MDNVRRRQHLSGCLSSSVFRSASSTQEIWSTHASYPILIGLINGIGNGSGASPAAAISLLVIDTSDGVIVGVSVTVRHPESGLTRQVTAEADGALRVEALQLGNYSFQPRTGDGRPASETSGRGQFQRQRPTPCRRFSTDCRSSGRALRNCRGVSTSPILLASAVC